MSSSTTVGEADPGSPALRGVLAALTRDPIALTLQELEEFLGRVKSQVAERDFAIIQALVSTVRETSQLLGEKSASIALMRRLLFGSQSEKTKDVVGRAAPGKSTSGDDGEAAAQDRSPSPGAKKRTKAKGHGRNPASAYTGAQRIKVDHEKLHAGVVCPDCEHGKLHRLNDPAQIVRVIGQPSLSATIWCAERLRCGGCGEVFTADVPPEARGPKYDETAGSMLAILRYGNGFPGHRLEQHQADLGIPVPASVQSEVVSDVADDLGPVFGEFLTQAAQRNVVHNDDTGAKILEYGKVVSEEAGADSEPKRKGTFTTGIIARGGGPDIALFFTGRRHAGENLLQVLKRRLPELGPPIQMCDALSRNYPEGFQTIVANCLAHGRRKFVDVAHCFPTECGYVLEQLAVVYRNDAHTKKTGMSDQERLDFHKIHSRKPMDDLHGWLKAQFDERKVEPNSSLGKAITYMTNHWEKLTLFLTQAGAPLDNNVCERGLKMVILQRKNSLFYKTDGGAAVGDLLMSLIYTCRLNGANPFRYLTALQVHKDAVHQNPSNWTPWMFQQALAELKKAEATNP